MQPETLDARVPNLILQPLVENAIKHGVARKSGPGHIDITARGAATSCGWRSGTTDGAVGGRR